MCLAPFAHALISRIWCSLMKGKCFSFLVAASNLSQRKGEVEEKMSLAKRDSKQLLDYTRKAIARLTFLKR